MDEVVRSQEKAAVSAYTLYVTPDAWNEIKKLPGNMRQRVRRAIEKLAEQPRPPKSKALTIPELECDVRRLRLERWRIVYATTETSQTVDVLAVRKRPPFTTMAIWKACLRITAK
jgi:mRNA interferase RelE/StbE